MRTKNKMSMESKIYLFLMLIYDSIKLKDLVRLLKYSTQNVGMGDVLRLHYEKEEETLENLN